MPAPRRKPRYIIVEYTGDKEYDTVAGAAEAATKANEHEPGRTFAVVELVTIITSERKVVVNRIK